MSDEKKLSLDELEEILDNEQESAFSIRNIYAMVILNWQWILLSLIIFISGALIYLRYATPVYQASAKMLIKDDQSSRRRANQALSNMTDLGFMTNSTGIENEVEIIQSTILAREAVKRLKLYTEYRTQGRVSKPLTYKYQPINVDLDAESLNRFDSEIYSAVHGIDMTIVYEKNAYHVDGAILHNGRETRTFQKTLTQLPASIRTSVGTLTFTKNAEVANKRKSAKNDEEGDGAEGAEAKDNSFTLLVSIRPPMMIARRYVASLSVAPTSKLTSIAELTLTNENGMRAMDYLKELAHCYNDQANADKNEIALKTEEFINNRIEKINAELGTTESNIESYKRRNAVTQLNIDATQSLTQSSQYESRLAEANSQIQLLDYLREFVDNPANQYKIIPSNVGMTDHASTALIANYNQTVQDRNRLLKAASEQAPQVLTLTATLDELQGSIRTALLQARRTADIQRQGIQSQYTKYQGRIGSTPEQERVLTQIGRQQEVKSGLYLLLLQKREENSISLAATADKGKLIDEPQLNGKVRPKSAIIILVALVLGLALPFAILYLLQLLRYRIEGHEDVARLTKLPIVADVPVASDTVKDAAGIVVQANKNNQIDEIFRSLRTNIQFLMKESDKVILFTSSTSGEGKTFLAANLAVSFALLGKKVVLCGMDIRKPALGRLFNITDRRQGITNLLTKDVVTVNDVKAQMSPSGVNDNLDLLLAGPTPPNPTELLARENLHQVIEVLKGQYDYIILDTAPVGLVTDTIEIARYSDVNCYVCRADYTPKSNIGLLNSLSDEGKLVNSCVVLNGVDMSKKKYGYYYGYGKYGKYGRYGYGRYGYGKYGYGNYGNYGNYGRYADSHYGNKDDNSIKK